MNNSITDVPGFLVGHAEDPSGLTGCTVVLCPPGAATGVDSRGGAPGTRETDCLRPENVVPVAHAVFLSGGSAFGLDCAAGIMRWMEERKFGFDVGVTRVPIVPGAVLNDLAFTDAKVRPDASLGYAACMNASAAEARQGNVGAGAGACIGRLSGTARGMMKGGLGTASVRVGDLIVGAVVAVNCNGDVMDPDTGDLLAGTLAPDGGRITGALTLISDPASRYKEGFPTNTTIGVVASNALLTKAEATRVAMAAQDGLARSIYPVHTLGDGDVVFCMAAGTVEAQLNRLGALASRVMERAIVNAVKAADSAAGVVSWKELRQLSQ